MRFFLFLIAALIFAAPQAWGCRIELPTEETKLDFVKRTFKEADYIIEAKVLKIIPDPKSPWYFAKAILTIKKQYKGELPHIIEANFSVDPALCGVDLRPQTTSKFEVRQIQQTKDNSYLLINPARYLWGVDEKQLEDLKTASSKSYTKALPETNTYITVLEPRIFGTEKDKHQPLQDIEVYKNLLVKLIKSCKSIESIDSKKTDFYNSENRKRPYYINLAFLKPESTDLLNKNISLMNFLLPYNEKEKHFISPYITAESGDIYQLNQCDFPDTSAFFEPATPPAQ